MRDLTYLYSHSLGEQMGKISIIFSDGHEFTTEVTDESRDTVVNAYIDEYLEEHPGVSVEQRVYMGDRVNEFDTNGESEEDDSLVKEDGELKESQDRYSEDSEYLEKKHRTFLGLEFIHGSKLADYCKQYLGKSIEELTDEERYGRAFKMSKEDLIKEVNRFDIERSLYMLRYKYNIALDEPIEKVEEEKLLNVLGHRNIVVSYNEDREKWQCVIPLRDGLIIHLSETACGAGLRGFISRLSGRYINNNDIIDTWSYHWRTVNKEEFSPLDKSREYIDRLAKEVGTSVDEIEEHYKKTLAKQQNAEEQATANT